MKQRELTKPYAPNPVLRAIYQRFFSSIQVDEAWVKAVRQLSEVGTVIYILRNLSFIDFLALDHLTKKYRLPQIRFVNDLGLWIFNPMGKGWWNAISPKKGTTAADELFDAVERGGTAALFLKRPPTVLDIASGVSHGRGLTEGDELVRALFDLQRRHSRPILLVPQVFMWSRYPDTRGTGPLDVLFGSREWPSAARTLGQFLFNYKHVALKVGEPLNIKEFLASANGLSDDVLVRRITYAVLRRLERERRSVIGPADKAPDRVREEILRSPRLRAVIDDLSGGRPQARPEHVGRALELLKELQATPDQKTLKSLEVVFDRVFHRIYAGIDYNPADIERVRQAARDGAMILLPSHKSHVDYLILSYVFNEQNLPLPRIAAGENLNFFPMGPIFRRGGAFFIRRSFRGDRLYAAVVDAYVRRLIRDGFPIELFMEGGRSRTGKLLPPKFGLLNMLVDAALAVPQRTTSFVPVSIGYERVVEASSFQRELSGGEKEKENARGLLQSHQVLWHRYGRINIQFGQILTLEEICQRQGLTSDDAARPAKRRTLVTRLGNRVMDEINRVTAVTPGALTALSLLSHEQRGISQQDLLTRCQRLLGVVTSLGARATPGLLTPSGALRTDAILEALQMFLEAELLETYSPHRTLPRPAASRLGMRRRYQLPRDERAFYTVRDTKRLALDTTKNIIVHFFVERALVAIALLTPPGIGVKTKSATRDHVPRHVIKERVQELSRLFKYEFRFRADAPFETIFDETVAGMITAGHLAATSADGPPTGNTVTDNLPKGLCVGPGSDDQTGMQWLWSYASILRNFIEGYQIAARSLQTLLDGPLSDKELVKQALSLGDQMYMAGEIERREAVSKPLFENAYQSFSDQGVLRQTEKTWELTEDHLRLEAVSDIEARLMTFLGTAPVPPSEPPREGRKTS